MRLLRREGFPWGRCALPVGVEEVAVGLGGEGAGDGLGEAESEEAGADGGFGSGGGVGDDDAGGGEGVGEAVVAVDAGDLFDEVDLALEVEAPGRELDEEGCRLLVVG